MEDEDFIEEIFEVGGFDNVMFGSFENLDWVMYVKVLLRIKLFKRELDEIDNCLRKKVRR